MLCQDKLAFFNACLLVAILPCLCAGRIYCAFPTAYQNAVPPAHRRCGVAAGAVCRFSRYPEFYSGYRQWWHFARFHHHRLFRLKPTPSDRTIRGIAGIRTVSFLNNQKLHLPGLTVDSLNFHVNNYDILTSVYGEKIDGIIGYSFLSRYILKIDYDTSQLEVWSRGSLKYPRGGYLMRPVITTLPVQQATCARCPQS